MKCPINACGLGLLTVAEKNVQKSLPGGGAIRRVVDFAQFEGPRNCKNEDKCVE